MSCRPFVCCRKETADGPAWRSQRPRCHSKTSDQERGDDVKAGGGVTADCRARHGRARQVEEAPGIRPFLEPRKSRHEYGNASQHFPRSDDRKKVHWIAKLRHYAMRVGLKLQ